METTTYYDHPEIVWHKNRGRVGKGAIMYTIIMHVPEVHCTQNLVSPFQGMQTSGLHESSLWCLIRGPTT